MLGHNPQTLEKIDGLSRLFFSLHDMYTTPVGTRLGTRPYGRLYGCRMNELIGKSLNPENVARGVHYIASAHYKPDGSLWEPEFHFKRAVPIVNVKKAHIDYEIYGDVKINDKVTEVLATTIYNAFAVQ